LSFADSRPHASNLFTNRAGAWYPVSV